MCTKSVVRFRFSLKDNCETLDTLDLKTLTHKDISNQSKYLSTICSIRSTVGLNTSDQLITEDLNMNKGLQNGHQLHDNQFIDNNLDINSIATSTTTTSTTPSLDTSSLVSTDCEPTMGLSNATSKDSLTQHLLLTSLKSGKPENGQRLDLSTIPWHDLKSSNANNAMHSAAHSPQTVDNISENQMDANCLSQNSPLNDQTVDQMIEEVLNKSESQVSEELTANPILENNTSDEQQPQHDSSFTTQPIGDSKGTQSDELESEPNVVIGVEPDAIDATEEHMSLVRQTERLMRRIRRLQFKQTHKHLNEQMRTFVKNQQNVLAIGCQRQPPEPINTCVSQMQSQSHSNPVEDRMKLLTPEGVKGLSTSALVNLVKRLGSSTTPNESKHMRDYYPQQTPNRSSLQTPSSTSTPQSSSVLPQTPTTTTQHLSNSSDKSSLVKLLQKSQSHSSAQPLHRNAINAEDKDAILTTLDTLSTNLRHFETSFDSDATESSSGGESCDELDEFSDDSLPQHSTPIQSTGHLFPMRKRSCWKWCVERAAIASRWTWLQAQVADLEFRIRQQNEMYRQLRATKGLISFGTSDQHLTVPTPIVCNTSTTLSNTSVTTSAQPMATQSQVTAQVSVPPPPLPANTDSDSHYSMRTLPMNSMRKRKLVHSMSALSGATRKAAKYSTIQCSCNGLPDMMWPCVLCNGRYSYVHVIDTDSMPHFERVALLDSACHPVLSLNNDVSLGLHFTELLKRETIQRPIPLKHQNKKRRNPPSPTLSNKFLFDSSKNKSPKRSQSVISSTKLKKKYDGSAKRRYVRRSGSSDGVWRKRGRPRERASSGSSRTESPIPSPVPSEGSNCGHSMSAPLHRRRRSEQHAFDINNIVIPYSIAATTRVEKLQYKEIITPKWRICDPSEPNFSFALNNDLKMKAELSEELIAVPLNSASFEDEEEDISDVAFTSRHIKCEEEERKRILSFIKGNKTGSLRRGARVRFDSNRSDTNTPAGDTVFHNNDSTSQDSYTGVSAPPTPVINNCNNESNNLAETPPPIIERKRNASLSSRRDDSIDENFEVVSPFELRTFPLNDMDFDLMSIQEVQPLCPPMDDTLDSMIDPEKSNEGTITANNSRAPTPVDSEGAESGIDHNEGDNDEDPEWEPKKLAKV